MNSDLIFWIIGGVLSFVLFLISSPRKIKGKGKKMAKVKGAKKQAEKTVSKPKKIKKMIRK